MTDISTTDEKLLFCSFCGKNQNEVKKLIAGPSVYICDECVSLCNDIIKEDLESKEAENSETKKLPIPEEINSFLNDYVIGQEDAKKLYPLPFTIITRNYKTWMLIQKLSLAKVIFFFLDLQGVEKPY